MYIFISQTYHILVTLISVYIKENLEHLVTVTFNFLAATVDLELDPTTPPSASFCVLELEQLA